jgi:hypothetical protein
VDVFLVNVVCNLQRAPSAPGKSQGGFSPANMVCWVGVHFADLRKSCVSGAGATIRCCECAMSTCA